MNVRSLIAFAVLVPLVYARSGFRTLAWNETWGAYTVSVLEDFHAAGQSDARLFVQLSDAQEAAPKATQVEAVVRYESDLLYEGEVPYLLEE